MAAQSIFFKVTVSCLFICLPNCFHPTFFLLPSGYYWPSWLISMDLLGPLRWETLEPTRISPGSPEKKNHLHILDRRPRSINLCRLWGKRELLFGDLFSCTGFSNQVLLELVKNSRQFFCYSGQDLDTWDKHENRTFHYQNTENFLFSSSQLRM